MKLFIAKSCAVLAISILTVSSSMAKDYKWDMANEYPATSFHGETDTFFAKKMAEKTSGRIEITNQFGGALGFKSKDQYDAVGDGAVIIANTYPGHLVGINPMFLFPLLPFWAVPIENARVLWDIARPDMEKILEKDGSKLLYAAPWPPSGIWSKKKISSVKDLENLKIRCSDKAGIETFKNLGAAPIQLSWGDVVPQLSTGGLDAVLTSCDGGVASSFYEHLNYFHEINYSFPLQIIHMNLDTYNSLPDELQTAVDAVATETEVYAWKRVVNRVAENFKKATDNNVTIVRYSEMPSKFKSATKAAGDKVVKDWVEEGGTPAENIQKKFEEMKK